MHVYLVQVAVPQLLLVDLPTLLTSLQPKIGPQIWDSVSTMTEGAFVIVGNKVDDGASVRMDTIKQTLQPFGTLLLRLHARATSDSTLREMMQALIQHIHQHHLQACPPAGQVSDDIKRMMFVAVLSEALYHTLVAPCLSDLDWAFGLLLDGFRAFQNQAPWWHQPVTPALQQLSRLLCNVTHLPTLALAVVQDLNYCVSLGYLRTPLHVKLIESVLLQEFEMDDDKIPTQVNFRRGLTFIDENTFSTDSLPGKRVLSQQAIARLLPTRTWASTRSESGVQMDDGGATSDPASRFVAETVQLHATAASVRTERRLDKHRAMYDLIDVSALFQMVVKQERYIRVQLQPGSFVRLSPVGMSSTSRFGQLQPLSTNQKKFYEELVRLSA
jgi:hypothetical protein